MAVIMCYRCDRTIDLDWDCTPVTKLDLPTLDAPEGEYVCETCLSERELKQLNGEWTYTCQSCGKEQEESLHDNKYCLKCFDDIGDAQRLAVEYRRER